MIKTKKGFTLIELMIVIAIIGILAAIAIPNFISYRNKAFCSRAESDATAIQSAISSYFSEPNNTTITDTALNASNDRPALNPSNTYSIVASTPSVSLQDRSDRRQPALPQVLQRPCHT